MPASGTETILVVDDLEVIRRLACEILKVGGYTVLQAPGGDEALQIESIHAGPIHLLLTDVVMPKMNGGDLAKTFSLRRPAAKVLYMSGYTKDAISQNSILDPGVEFIEKPFTPSTLLRKIQKILQPILPQ
jgi:DNA-binding NtrC family response regulator